MLNIVANTELRYEERKEKYDMCEAIRGMREDEYIKGVAQGVVQGVAQGVAQGEVLLLNNLVKKGLLSPAVAAEQIGLTVTEFEAKVKALEAK